MVSAYRTATTPYHPVLWTYGVLYLRSNHLRREYLHTDFSQAYICSLVSVHVAVIVEAVERFPRGLTGRGRSKFLHDEEKNRTHTTTLEKTRLLTDLSGSVTSVTVPVQPSAIDSNWPTVTKLH
jgi:hypothetical protein